MEDSSCVINSSSSSSSSDDFEDFMMLLHVCEYDEVFLDKMPQRTSSLRGEDFVMELLNGHGRTCYELFRMDKTTFLLLCANLKEKGYLKATKEVMIEEALAMFLIIVGHNVGMRVIADRFQHSLETVDRHFTLTLKAICKLAKDLIFHTNSPLPSHVVNNSKYYPWFQKCIGAIDGTHISASVPIEKQVTYRGRKVVVTQNVLCACNFDMMFTFVYAGWEGTANYSRVLLDAITRPENKFPCPKEGEYYVVDSGYPCTMGFLPPYRGERYHLQDYRGRGCQPKTYKELFNYRHSSLRNIIERCFGVLKARFPILKMMPSYKPSRQPLIVVACCTLYNFIRKWTQNDVMFRQWEEEELEFEDKDDATTEISHAMNLSDEAAATMATYRDRIAQQM